NDANRSGLSQLDAVLSGLNFGNFDLRNYFTNYLKYELSTDARLGMNLFLQKLRQYQANPAHLL
ncbi:MAG TPA: hypothetical protein VEX63_13510, partial [Flavisolibacter sp.]|nr:hypothetical protein [Flavisolibacter sp.]